MSTFTPNQQVEVEHRRHVGRIIGGQYVEYEAIWKPGKFLRMSGDYALVEYQTPVGMSRRSFPLDKLRPKQEQRVEGL